MTFQIGNTVKVKLNAQYIKPELKGKTCIIKAITGSTKPFHYITEINKKEYVFKGDELQTVFAHDMELLKLMQTIKQQ